MYSCRSHICGCCTVGRLCLACAPVSEVSLQSPWPNNHTRPLSSTYESNKRKFKPDTDWFMSHFCVCVHEQWFNKTAHTKKYSNISLYLQMCVYICLYRSLKFSELTQRKWQGQCRGCQNTIL